ncbi:hypothetical protein pb186bvf_007656 [Paramecium bursaria]
MDRQNEEGKVLEEQKQIQGSHKLLLNFQNQEPQDSSYSSSLQSLQDSPKEEKTKVQRSSFRRLSFSPLSGTSSYCIRYVLIGTCNNKECKRRHTLQISQQELEELIDDNLDQVDQLLRSGQKLRINKNIYENKIQQYQKSTQENNISEIQFQLQEIPIINCYPNSGYYSMISSSSSSHPIVIPQPQLDFKSLQEIIDKQGSSLDLVNAFKKDLMQKLKQDIDKMTDKLKVLGFLKQCVIDQSIDQQDFYEIYNSLTGVQQIHLMNLFKIMDLQAPEITKYCVNEEVKQSFKEFMQKQQPSNVRNMFEQMKSY